MVYRPDIDGLRAVAVLSVVLFHAGFNGVPGGFIGVDIFFVISGFLITSIITREINEDRFTFLNFYERRARRILPALFAVIVASLIAGYYLMLPDPYRGLNNSAFSAVLSLSNIYFWRQTGYFSDASELFPLLHTWSLSVEEQFYIIFPVLLIFLKKIKNIVLISIVIIFCLCSFLLSIWGIDRYPSATFFLLPTRAWELGIGVILALWHPTTVNLNNSWREIISWSGFLAILIPIFSYSEQTKFPGIAALFPCLGAAILIWIGMDNNKLYTTSVSKILSMKPIVFVGLISYSLYLWHWPILVFARHYTTSFDLNITITIFSMVFIFIISIISWQFIEKPFRNRNTLTTRLLVTFASSMTIIIITIALSFSFIFKGAFWRVPEKSVLLLNNKQDFSRKCMNEFTIYKNHDIPRHCSIGTGDRPSFLLWGDSHAAAIRPAIDYVARSKAQLGRILSFNACPPIVGVGLHLLSRIDQQKCDALRNRALHYAINTASISSVILTGYWEAYAQRNDFYNMNNGINYPPNKSHEVYLEYLEKTIYLLRSAGKRVIVLYKLPEVPFDVPWLLAMKSMLSQKLPLYFSDSTHSHFNEKLKEIAERQGAKIIALNQAICTKEGGKCLLLEGTHTIYKDNNHLSVFGAKKYFGKFLEDRIFKERIDINSHKGK